jgi:hypothetical protein
MTKRLESTWIDTRLQSLQCKTKKNRQNNIDKEKGDIMAENYYTEN